MITVKMQGGLGNQMFQYAFAYAYSKINNTEIYLDTGFYLDSGKYTYRPLSILNFCLTKFPRTTRRLGLMNKVRNYIISKIDSDRKIRFLQTNFLPSPFTYKDDYYQSEKYFRDFRNELLKEFSLKESEQTGVYLEIKQRIQTSKNPVIIHARRGDYLKHADTYTILDHEYYTQALKRLDISEPDIFIFSDDPDWLATIVRNYTYVNVSALGLTDYMELSLMTFGKYFIIPNSTFSWWGAWLSQTVGKKVFAPRNWFTKKHWDEANNDIVPTDWIRV
jgi:hypothetical protein